MFTKILEVAAPKPMINPQEEFQKMFAFKNAIYEQAKLQYQRRGISEDVRLLVCQYSPTSLRNRGQWQFIFSLLLSPFEVHFKDKTVTEHRPPKRTIPRMRLLTLAMLSNDLRSE